LPEIAFSEDYDKPAQAGLDGFLPARCFEHLVNAASQAASKIPMCLTASSGVALTWIVL